MIKNINKCIRLLLTSIVMLVTTLSVHANTVDIYNYNAGSSEILSKEEEESEKIITNAKVNYNPIAEVISVSFKLAKQNNVVIKLMDALGNEISSLSNSTLDAGSHSLSFETEGKIATGVYFIRISSGTETIVKRIAIQ